MDKTLSMIDFDKADFINYLMANKGFSRQDAETTAELMGY